LSGTGVDPTIKESAIFNLKSAIRNPQSEKTLAGHADLSDFYDTGAVALLVSQLQDGP